MLERLVGLPEVTGLGLFTDDERVELHIESISERSGCAVCGVAAQAKGWREVVLVDLQFAGKPAALHWHKRRWRCAEDMCPSGSWTEQDDRIAHPRMKLTRRASLRATEDVGRKGRRVNEVAEELGCDWHTINDVVLAYGEALVDHPERFSHVEALGLDETAFVRTAHHRTEFVTSIVDVKVGQLLDLVPGRGGPAPREWLMGQSPQWRNGVKFATLDLSGAYKTVLDACVPRATQVDDRSHVIKLANERVDECRRRVQNEVRGLYGHQDQALAHEWIDALAEDFTDKIRPIEVRSLGRALKRWRLEITAWHACHFTNGTTEAMNNLIKRIKRVAFGFTNFRNYRVRSLLYAGKPDWSLLATLSPLG